MASRPYNPPGQTPRRELLLRECVSIAASWNHRLDPGDEAVRVAALRHNAPRPLEVEDQSFARLERLHDSGRRLADLHVDRVVVGDEVTGVAGESLALLQLVDVECAVRTEHDWAITSGMQDERALATTEHCQSAELCVELDACCVRQPTPTGDNERPSGRHVTDPDVARQVGCNVDPRVSLRMPRVGRDEKRFTAEDAALERTHQPAAHLCLDRDAERVHRHRARLGAHLLPRCQMDPGDSKARLVAYLDPHAFSSYLLAPRTSTISSTARIGVTYAVIFVRASSMASIDLMVASG